MSAKCLALVALAVISLAGLEAFSYQTYYLNDYCGSTLTLPCSSDAYNRAGTLRFRSYPSSSCNVTVKIDRSSTSCRSLTYYGVYFNVKKFDLLSSDSLTVTQRSQYYPYGPTVLKQLSGSTSHSSFTNPTSVAQLLTPVVQNPVFSIVLARVDTGSTFAYDGFVLDYNVVSDMSSSYDTYCSALGYYVYDDLMCESGDRVNCPTTYYSTLGFNPVYSTNQMNDCYLATGSIVGIVFGVIAGIVFFAAIATLICRRQRHQIIHRHVAGVSVPVGNQYQHQAAVVVTQNYPGNYPQQQYAGAPPSYGTVPQPAPYMAGGTVMPEPPKQF